MHFKTLLIFYYSKPNKFSFNTLLGALDSDDYFDHFLVEICSSESDLFKTVKNNFNSYKKIIIGFSFFTSQIKEIQLLVLKIKESFKNNVLLMAGGPHASAEPNNTLKMGFDLVIKGEGEETLIELIKEINAEQNYLIVPGIAYLDPLQNYCETNKRNNLDLNLYHPFSARRHKLGPIEITRGCPFACSFCQTSFLFGQKLRHRSVDKISEAVLTLKTKGLKDIRFLTPNALAYGSENPKAVNLAALDALLGSVKSIMKNQGRIFFGTFPSELRPELLSDASLKIITRYADNETIDIGAQSGSPRMLQLCNRGHSVEDVYNAVDKIRYTQFKPMVDFIFGLPDEKEEDTMQSLSFIDNLLDMNALIRFHHFLPLPGTPWGQLKPTPLSKKSMREIEKRINRKGITGNFKKQLEMSQYIDQNPNYQS